jgi:hypothetical protein
MKIFYFVFMLCFLFSCSNRIETGDTLSQDDIKYMQGLNLLDKDEKVYKFYSEFKKKTAGNFFTNKRIAKYWIDDRNKEKNQVSFAFYPDIKSIDTFYNAGSTYCPYMLVTRSDSSQFKVCADGEKKDIKSFFEDAIMQWQQHKNDTNK